MKRWKKCGAIVLLISVIASLAGCAGDDWLAANDVEIVLGTDDFSMVSGLVRKFNQQKKGLYITVVEYGYDKEKTIEDLKEELAEGTAPDMLAIAHHLVDVDISDDTYYVDLMDFLENDEFFNAECIVPSLLEALQHDGTLMWLPSEFMITTYTACGSEIEKWKYLSPARVQSYVEDRDDKVDVFQGTRSAEALLRDLSALVGAAWNSGLYCDVDEVLAEALALCSNHREREDSTNNSQCVLTYCPLWGVSSAAYQKFIWGEDYDYVGFPLSPLFGSYFSSSGVSYAISKSSKSCDAAWGFIQYAMLLENQARVSGFPVTREGLDKVISASAEKGELTDGDVDKLLTLIEDTVLFSSQYNEMEDIVYTLGSSMLEGTATLEETVEAINIYCEHLEAAKT